MCPYILRLIGKTRAQRAGTSALGRLVYSAGRPRAIRLRTRPANESTDNISFTTHRCFHALVPVERGRVRMVAARESESDRQANLRCYKGQARASKHQSNVCRILVITPLSSPCCQGLGGVVCLAKLVCHPDGHLHRAHRRQRVHRKLIGDQPLAISLQLKLLAQEGSVCRTETSCRQPPL